MYLEPSVLLAPWWVGILGLDGSMQPWTALVFTGAQFSL